jgi:hypothetical protein
VRSITFPSAGCKGTVAFPSESRANGPLSLTTTVIDLVTAFPCLSFVVYVTVTVWPSFTFSAVIAAVILFGSNLAPLAVSLPGKLW